MALGQHVTSALVKSTLGASIDEWSQLILHANINKWSKYKPVRGTYPASSSGKYGLDLSLWNNSTGTFSPSNWDYLRPRGGVYFESYRTGDFRGYEHNSSLTLPPAYCKDSDQEENSVLYPSQPSGAVASNTAKGKFNSTTSSVRLTVTDLGLQNYYFGVLLITPSGRKYIQTVNTTLGSSSESTGLLLTYSAALESPTSEDWSFVNLPKETGSFTAYYVISNTNYYSNAGVWTENPSGTIYRLPSGSVTGLTFKNSFTFTVQDWIYAETGSLSFAYSADDLTDAQSSRIFTSLDTPFTVNTDDATWIEYKVYASDGTTDITSTPSSWSSGCYLKLYPINANGGSAKTGTVYVQGTGISSYPISVTQQASPATVNVYAGNDTIMSISAASGNLVGGLNIEFTPHYVPGGDSSYDVCWYIKVNDVDMYSSLTTGLACQDDVHKNSTSISYGSATWNDGDVIDIYLYYESAPALG
jgi:hypothetical protein